MAEVFVGIDVSKARLDVAVKPPGEVFNEENTDAGVIRLAERLLALSPTLVVLKATGGWEQPSVLALAERLLPIVVVNPRQVRDFAKATGRRAKTDVLDAVILALFADAVRPCVRQLPDQHARTLEALLSRRRQVIEMIVAEPNRLNTARATPIHDGIKAHLLFLEQQRAELDHELLDIVRADPSSSTR